MAYEPTFESLGGIEIPDWVRNAKFGIWSHWGPQSVPMCGDWYARNMYVEGTPQYLYHLRHYGHPSKFGYKDICALWKAENFDPDALMARYHRAGARYFVAQAMHHDHFFHFPSKLNPMNSANVGPKKDIVGLWKAAAEKFGMPFGLTEHLSASFSWWRVNKGADRFGPFAGVPYDGNDPAWRDFYFDNYEHGTDDPGEARPWFTGNKKFHAYWRAVMGELIDRYRPDMLYTDGSLPFGTHWEGATAAADLLADPAYASGLEVVARLYNTSGRVHGANRAIYTQKDAREAIYRVGILDVERGRLPGIAARAWQTDTCIGGWFYDAKQPYKTPAYLVGALVDIISKNGALLLNILQRPDGTIDDEAGYILDELAGWFAACAEGVYGTRPWRVYGEGTSRARIESFHEDETDWREDDIRFTRKGNTLYAFLMAAPKSRVAVIKSLDGERVIGARLLGAGEVEFSQSFGVVAAKLPERLPTKYANCLALELEGKI